MISAPSYRVILQAFVLALTFVLPVPTHADLGSGVDAFRAGDHDAALAAFRPAAEAGDPEAQYWPGRMYDGGAGVDFQRH